ncbi:(2Fe-2S)-binding protein [Marinactinospora thermotolerans]|uniref:FhuF 2Fe-2S C-terminal domain-containing protein n=1 Tax=Marinactinospora thermotolerans DSM 45154 TaxID=1122192 RepID=A0A1T4TD37_9ACTN|nr:(2Fe-2S)-binding protein [Marinactinospora thermotolerans]SKA38414.1 FhuF 2Fe-2S C-terminal domain-containing protein [Marinactinospora thermotolerans DSM 45154]
MAHPHHPLQTVVDACAPLKFAPLPDLRVPGVTQGCRRPGAEHWYRADLMAAQGAVGTLFDQLTAHHGPHHRLPATTHFMRALLREPIFLVSAGIYLTGRAPLLDGTRLWFPWHADATFGVPTLTGAKVAVPAGDPFADHPDAVVVADAGELDRIAAEHLFRAFAPILDALHAHTRAGLRTLWGWVLDTMHFYMLNPARFLGRDAEAAWRRADRLGDALISAGAVTRARPRLFPFYENHPRGTWAVRGTCCFDYKGDPEHGYCTTCPLKCDSDRRAELREWIRNPALAP